MNDARLESLMSPLRLPDGQTVWHVAGSHLEVLFIYEEIFAHHVYERLAPVLSADSVVVDAGANIGLFTLSLLAREIPIRVLCFEPVPATRACLKRNLATARRHVGCRIDVRDCALGKLDGYADVTFLPRAPGNSTMFPEKKPDEFHAICEEQHSLGLRNWLHGLLQKELKIVCPISRLSTAIALEGLDRIDLLKIDVEGAELELLDGLDESDWHRIRHIAMECALWNKPRLPMLRAQLLSRGFRQVVFDSPSGTERALNDGYPCMMYACR
jgi:FkbM family methyltransferase